MRCTACGRGNQWPHPELGCPCGTVLRLALSDPPAAPHPGPAPTAPAPPATPTPPPPTPAHPSTPAPPRTTAPPAPPAQPPAPALPPPPAHPPTPAPPRAPAPPPAPPATPAQPSAPALLPPAPAHPQPPAHPPTPAPPGAPAQAPTPAPAPSPAPAPAAAPAPAPAPARRGPFRPVTIRTARDAVPATALYLRWLGYRGIRRADQRPPSGVGLAAHGLVAQVDPAPRPAAPRDVECLWLTAMSESAGCAYFSLAGYDEDARACADTLGVPLFVLDLTGIPTPVNGPGRALAEAGAA
ncbi:hypothetical protein [Streptomyces collinus]|uniref:hypothetical protein n=1 Tax=Streptomyces collinus TaxID=42684 RepID=UPI0036E5C010